MNKRLQKFFSILCALTLLMTSVPATVMSDPEIPAEPVTDEASQTAPEEGDPAAPELPEGEEETVAAEEPAEGSGSEDGQDPIQPAAPEAETESNPEPVQDQGEDQAQNPEPALTDTQEAVPVQEQEPAAPQSQEPAQDPEPEEEPAEEPAEEPEEEPDEEPEADLEPEEETAETPKLRLNETFRDALEAGAAYELTFCPEADMNVLFTLTLNNGGEAEFSFAGMILTAEESETLETGESRTVYQAEVRAWQNYTLLLTSSAAAEFSLAAKEQETETEQSSEEQPEVQNTPENEQNQPSDEQISDEEPIEDEEITGTENTEELTDKENENSDPENDVIPSEDGGTGEAGEDHQPPAETENEQPGDDEEDELSGLSEEERALIESYKQQKEEGGTEAEGVPAEEQQPGGADTLNEDTQQPGETEEQKTEETEPEEQKTEEAENGDDKLQAEADPEGTEQPDEAQLTAEEAAKRAEESAELTAEEIAAEALSEEETSALVAEFFAPRPSLKKVSLKKSGPAAISADQQKTGYAAFDISLANEDKTGYGSYTVPVELDSAIDLNSLKPEAGEKDVYVISGAAFELYHVKENEDGSQYIENVSVTPYLDEDGILTGFGFTTDGFSTYILKYTVDFHYNGVDYSIPGNSQILLSELIEQLQIKNGDALLNVADVESVTFTDEHLVTVEQVSGLIVYNGVESVDVGEKDFLLSSAAPFSTEETLAIGLNSGMVIPVGVTDDAVWYKTVHLRGRDEISLQEIMGDEYSDKYIFWSQHPSEINREDTKLTNISCIPYSEEGYVFIWDWDQYDYAYYVFLVQDIIYKVSETGEIPLADVIASINVENENYYATLNGQYSSAVDYNSNDNVFTIRDVSAIPDEGVLFDVVVVDQSNYSYAPFGILIMPDRTDEEDDGPYHDDMFWYTLVKNENGRVTEAIVDSVYEEYHGTVLEFTNRTRDGKYPVKQIKAGAFKGNTVISEIHTDNKLNGFVFDEETFEGMTSLERVSIGTSENTSGQVTVKENAFKDCSALKSFACHYSSATIEANAFTGCTALETVVFTGKDSFKISTDAFTDAVSVQYLRIDNSYDMKGGTFAIADGTAFVQNNDAPLNGNLAAKVGKFGIYVFEKNPWWMSSDAFSQASVASSLYFADPIHVTHDLVNTLKYAHKNLKDVYFDCAREEFPYADELASAGVKAKIHYNENTEIHGFYLDGVNGNDETADGSAEKPYKTFGKLAEDWASLSVNENADPVTETDAAITMAVDGALTATGVDKSAGTFITNIIREKEAFIQNTVKITGNEIWDYTGEDELVLNRDPGFKGIMVQNNGTLTLKHVVLDGGGEDGVTATEPIIKSDGTLNIHDGAVIRNNNRTEFDYPDKAGGIYASGFVTMDGGEISGNTGALGGGIFVSSGTFNMSGGTIHDNSIVEQRESGTNYTLYYSNGGGVFLARSTMNFSGGQISGNKAVEGSSYWNGQAGGGISVGGGNSALTSSTLNMTGGTISGNTAGNNGGGIYIEDSCKAYVSHGSIENNTATGGVFGGGGIYVNGNRAATDGVLYLTDAVITDNTSIATSSEDYGGGGGLGGCNTSTTTIYQLDGAAIYGNHSQTGADLYFDNIARNSQSSARGFVSQYMFDGTDNHWTDPRTGKEVPPAKLASILSMIYNHVVLLKSNPEHAPSDGKVFIIGNTGALGGGIGSNGSVIIGNPPEPETLTWTPEADKILYNRDMKDGETFTFKVYEEKTSQGQNFWWTRYNDELVGSGSVTGGKNGKKAQIDFTEISLGKVTASMIGKARTFLIIEDTPDEDDLFAPDRYLAITVVIGTNWDAGQQKEGYSAFVREIEIGKIINGHPEFDNKYDGSTYDHNSGRIRETVTEAVFYNYCYTTELTVKKVWEYLSDYIAPSNGKVVFELYADGKTTGKQIILDGIADETGEAEPWVAKWTDLPVYRMNANGEYFKIHDYDDEYSHVEYAVVEVSCEPACYTAKLEGQNLTTTTQNITFNFPHTYYYNTVTLQLFADGEPVDAPKELVLDSDTGHHWQDDPDGWVALWSNLPVYRLDENGKLYKESSDDEDFARIEYTVQVVSWTEDEWNTESDQPPFAHNSSQAVSKMVPVTVVHDNTIITNVYKAESETNFTGQKTIENRDFRPGDKWTFTVTATDGIPMPSKTVVTIEPTNGRAIRLDFGQVKYTEADIGKEYVYTITETGSSSGVLNDSTTHTVKVEVDDNKDGTLKIIKTYSDGDEISFTNIYKASGGTALSGTKMIENREFRAGDKWTFTVTAEEGTPMPERTEVTIEPAEGSSAAIDFGTIAYTLADVGKIYTYTITESGTVAGVTNASAKTVTVTVADNGDGTLQVTNSSETTPLVFVNTYNAAGKTTLSGTKRIENRDFRVGDQWTFTVTAEEGTPMPERTSVTIEPAEGSSAAIDFGTIAYTLADVGKIYTYTITESGTVAGVTNASAKTVTVTVADNGDGTLQVTNSSETTPLIFINTWEPELPETGSLEVTKTVVSTLAADHEEAFRFTVTLSDSALNGTYGGMTFTNGTASFDLADGETVTATGLPAGITFTVAETENIGFTVTASGETGTITTETARAVFTNTRRTGGLEIIKRVTVDGAPANGTLADGVYTFTVTRDGEAVAGSPVTIRIANGTAGRAELTGLLPGIYLVREEAAGNGTVLTNGNNKPVVITEEDIETVQTVTFINNYKTPEEPKKETIDISGSKVWVDNDNRDGTRPEKITINLYADGRLTARATVTAAKNWQWTFKGLNKLDNNGREISYTISEEPVAGYTSVVNGYHVTNYAVPKDGALGILKVWDDLDDLDGSRPESLQVTLTADGTPVRTVTLNAGNNWSAEIEGLPQENNGKAIVYAWKEEAMAGYTSSQETKGALTVMTNRHMPEMTEVSVRKVWDDHDNALGIRPGSVTMVLSNGMRVTLNADNGWFATVRNLPVSYRGETILYSWTELEPAGYILEDVSTVNGVTTFTNTVWERPEPPEEENKRITTVHRPGTPLVELEDYDTALGVEVIINHVGHCFD